MGFSGYFRFLIDVSRYFRSLIDVGGYSRSLTDANRYLILVEFSRIIRLVDLSKFLKFQFRVRVVFYRAFLLTMGGGK